MCSKQYTGKNRKNKGANRKVKATRPVGAMCLQTAAKVLSERGIASGSREIFKQLRRIGFLDRHSRATAKALRMCWLREKSGEWARGGASGTYTRVFITRAGIDEAERLLSVRLTANLPGKAGGGEAAYCRRRQVKEVNLGIEAGMFGF
jgi:hypothetical protein